MKFSININQKQAIELGVENINQAMVLDLLTAAAVWAKPEVIDGDVFYWVSKNVIADELTLAKMKPDTVYRHLKFLDKIGVIIYKKIGKKDCIKITDKGRKYYAINTETKDVSPVDNQSQNSELDPNNNQNSDLVPNNTPKLGSSSENNSDLDPTDQLINNIREKGPLDFEIPSRKSVDNFASTHKLDLSGYFDYRTRDGWKIISGDKSKPIGNWQADARLWAQRQKTFGHQSTSADVVSIKPLSERIPRPAAPYRMSEKSKKIGKAALAGLTIRRVK